MRRSEYLRTTPGQIYERRKRLKSLVCFQIDQEPKSKHAISKSEKKEFQSSIRNQLKVRGKRVFRGDIILRIEFDTTQHDPPAIHTLSKNYIDLLNKILYKDDSQIKTLIAYYRLNRNEPLIRIFAYRHSDFIKDIELVHNILRGDFDLELDWIRKSNKLKDFGYDYFDFVINMATNKKRWAIEYEKRLFALKEYLSIKNIQETILQNSCLSIRDVIALYQYSFLCKNRNQSVLQSLQKQLENSKKLVLMKTTLIELGGPPSSSGQTKVFQANVRRKLNEFRAKHKILFPLLQPISVTAFFTPPKIKGNPKDLDNIMREWIIPFINESFEPPYTISSTYKSKYISDYWLKFDGEYSQAFPKQGVTHYQVIYFPRSESSSEDGSVDIFISDGFFRINDVWHLVDTVINEWEKSIG